jgi:FkbM family methyltransferase
MVKIDDEPERFKQLLDELRLLPDSLRARVQGHVTQVLLSTTVTTETPRGKLSFVALGRSGAGRGMRMLTKQPATIDWIDRFQPNSVFWDVGANVGIYTLYAALRGDVDVVAFEPAAVNYFLLTANCEANGFDGRVQCVLAGLGNQKSLATLEVSQFEPADSFSFRGKKDRPYPGRQSALILSMDHLVEEYGLACPNYIKIDVPGLSDEIIAGAERTLARPDVRELHMEVRVGSSGGIRMIETLKRCGLVPVGSHAHGSTDMTFIRA